MSDMRDLYQEVILDHNKKPRNCYAMDCATRTADGHNPLCGDIGRDGTTICIHDHAGYFWWRISSQADQADENQKKKFKTNIQLMNQRRSGMEAKCCQFSHERTSISK